MLKAYHNSNYRECSATFVHFSLILKYMMKFLLIWLKFDVKYFCCKDTGYFYINSIAYNILLWQFYIIILIH